MWAQGKEAGNDSKFLKGPGIPKGVAQCFGAFELENYCQPVGVG